MYPYSYEYIILYIRYELCARNVRVVHTVDECLCEGSTHKRLEALEGEQVENKKYVLLYIWSLVVNSSVVVCNWNQSQLGENRRRKC